MHTHAGQSIEPPISKTAKQHRATRKVAYNITALWQMYGAGCRSTNQLPALQLYVPDAVSPSQAKAAPKATRMPHLPGKPQCRQLQGCSSACCICTTAPAKVKAAPAPPALSLVLIDCTATCRSCPKTAQKRLAFAHAIKAEPAPQSPLRLYRALLLLVLYSPDSD